MKKVSWGYGLLILLLLAGGAFWGARLHSLQPSDKFKKLSPVLDFAFQDRSGRMVSRADFQGKIWVADFIFTSCAGTCPIMSEQMKRLQDIYKGNPRFKLVSLTVDPKRDTVAALKKYAESFQADENQWFFLTGEKKDIYHIIKDGFTLPAGDDPDGGKGYEFIHSSFMVLLDAKGIVRGHYDAQMEEEDMKKLKQDIKYLMASRSGT